MHQLAALGDTRKELRHGNKEKLNTGQENRCKEVR
jgi:hypothetical protein